MSGAGAGYIGARVFVGPQQVGRLGPRRHSVTLDLRGRPAGALTVRIVVHLRGGRTATDTRRLHLCARRAVSRTPARHGH